MKMPARSKILGMSIDHLEPSLACDEILNWSKDGHSRYICISNVHMCIESVESLSFRRIVEEADLVLADSQILAWTLKLLGQWDRPVVIRGLALMNALCEAASRNHVAVGLYGGTPESLAEVTATLMNKYPKLNIGLAISPPFRSLTDSELIEYVGRINQSNIQLLFLGIGCPKQEIWMAENKSKLSCTMVGVGAAFNFLGGVTKPSPSWVHPMGLEWLWRLLQEPKRLWRRYSRTNIKFIWLVIQQFFGRKF